MWYQPSVSATPPHVEPVTLEQARYQCGILPDESYFDSQLSDLISEAREYAEEYCNVRFAEVALTIEGDEFADLARLPTGPIQSLSAIRFISPSGSAEVLDSEMYRLHRDGIEPFVSLAPGARWPARERGSRIIIEGVFGGGVPLSVRRAMLMLISHWFVNRDAVVTGTIATTIPMGVDALLSNHRRGA